MCVSKSRLVNSEKLGKEAAYERYTHQEEEEAYERILIPETKDLKELCEVRHILNQKETKHDSN